MTLAYRRAEERDAPAMSAVVAAAQNDLHQRHGYSEQHMDPDAALASITYMLRSQPEGSFVAEDGGAVVGIGCAWMLGSFWFLADLFVEPAYQSRGVGTELLARTMAYQPGGTPSNRALITFAYNRVSTSVYAKHGMYPREPLYVMSCEASRVGGSDGAASALTIERVEARDASTLAAFRRIDEVVVGYARDEHHATWSAFPNMWCEALRHEGRIAGYAYVWETGRIGPVAVDDPALMAPLLAAAVARAASRADQITLMMPGANARGMDVAMRHGFRIELPLVVVAAEPFGRWDAYMPHSPGMM